MGGVVYPGSFDPMTRGHEDIVRRAACIFPHVTIAIAHSTSKTSWFGSLERVEMAHEVLKDLPNVDVCWFSGLLVDFLKKIGARIIIRGLRAVSDFEYEFQMAGMNRKLFPEVETVFLLPDEHHQFISATLVREIVRLGGDVSPFVHPAVLKRLQTVVNKA